MYLKEVIKRLKETYPLKRPDPSVPVVELWMESGRQHIIELLEIWEEQLKEDSDENFKKSII